MIKKTTSGLYKFSQLQKYKGVQHAISSITLGDMNIARIKNTENIKHFANISGFNLDKMIFMQQEHTKKVREVKKNSKFVYKKVDSLISQKKVILNTATADCVPILFYDPVTNTIATAHSGWKGTYKNIVKNVVKNLVAKNIQPSDLVVAIGPSIRGCCYNINKERFDRFRTKYADSNSTFLFKKNNAYFIDLANLVKMQLIKQAIKEENIEEAGLCTLHTNDFFSYRRKNNNQQVFLTSIGLI